MANVEAYSATNITASQIIKSGNGILGGIFCSTASASPTVTIYDNTAASGTKIIDTFTVASATPYPFPSGFSNGCYVAISGTASITVFWI